MTTLIACQSTDNTYKVSSSQFETQSYFESIKNDKHALRNFFFYMPKGGDIHHHALGAIKAEDYLEKALEKKLLIRPENHQLFPSNQSEEISESLMEVNQFLEANPEEEDKIIDSWSMRNYKANNVNGHDHFFDTFFKFEEAMIGNEPELLSKLCKEAATENLQYIETMVAVPSIIKRVSKLAETKEWKPEISVKDHLAEWYDHFEHNDIDHWVDYNVEVMDHWIEKTNTHGVTLRFQTVGFRILPNQAEVFGHLILAFKTALRSKNVVGVNFVAPEDHPLAIENYNTHMAMFRFLKKRFPKVNLSLHAGELNPEINRSIIDAVQFHIGHAVKIAGAQRIGHGFDLRYEKNKQETLKLMLIKGIAVEINLETNEVILESDSSSHPLRDYLEAGVPVCISSDDAGILRSDLSHQYVLLTEYIPEITFSEIKEIVFNSIRYSFLNKKEQGESIEILKRKFKLFETELQKKNKGA